MGLIAPVTLVGALVFHCVDVLAGITMAQIVRPGAPVLFGGAPATFHMKCREFADGRDRGAAPERRLRRGREVARPADAGLHGAQRRQVRSMRRPARETFGSALLAAIAGVNSVSGPGMLDFVLTFSLPKLVFDNEVCGQCLHFVRDIDVRRGPAGAGSWWKTCCANDHLITSPHTLKHWPQELYLTDPVIDRENRETWSERRIDGTASTRLRAGGAAPRGLRPH